MQKALAVLVIVSTAQMLACEETSSVKTSTAALPPVDGKVGSSSQLVPWFADSGRYGFADRSGALKIAARFTEARLFYDGLAAVRDGEEWGFIRESGEWQIRPDFSAVTDFRDGKAQAFHFTEPWLGPIMGLILRQGKLTSLVIDRSGAVLSTDFRRDNNLPPLWMPGDLFGQRYRMPDQGGAPWQEFSDGKRKVGVRHTETKQVSIAPRFDEVRFIVDADGSGVRFIAGRDDEQVTTGAWSVLDLTGRVLATHMWDVAPFASEGCFLGSAGENSWLALFDGGGKRLTPHLFAMPAVFRDGVAEGFVADAGRVFFDRSGRIYADLEYVRGLHKRVGRTPF